jgi:virginiamycin B lyase
MRKRVLSLLAAGSRLSAAKMRRRILNAGRGSILALFLLPLLGVAPARAAAGQISEFPVTQGSIDTQGSIESGRMALGADGDLYFGTASPATIGRITPSGQVTQFADPNTAASNVYLTVTGPDHNVWFADDGFDTTSKLGRITPAGQITTFSVPLFNGLPFVGIVGLAAGSDGNLWFTANAATTRKTPASFVGQVNPATGAITEFPIPSGATLPGAITTGSNGNLWFPEANPHPGVARVTTS